MPVSASPPTSFSSVLHAALVLNQYSAAHFDKQHYKLSRELVLYLVGFHIIYCCYT